MATTPADQMQDPMLGIIDVYFGSSEPGATLHHLVLAHAPSRNAFGLPDTTNLVVTVVAIAPVGEDEPADVFIARTITAAAIEKGPAWGAALTAEMYHGDPDSGDEVAGNRMRRMQGDRQLHLHPDAVEETILYAACADGRRWHGQHFLTGPNAGNIDPPRLIEGRPTKTDRVAPFAQLVRRAVGIPW